MATPKVKRRLAAVMAMDVVGYSRLMGEDETGTLERLKSLRKEMVQPKITEFNGRIVKLMGDGLLAEFPSAVEALQCGVDIQESMASREPESVEDHRIWLRIGINLGDIIVEGTDIYGDGVNVAARLEGLADTGGICISDAVRTAVGNNLDITYEDLGEQEVKNITKPVRAYKVALHQGIVKQIPAFAGTGPADDTPDKPSIAVLPFTNMSGDPEQEYFADGITEDIITNLSRFRDFFVIARNSTFAYKGKGVNIQDVSRELGVSYVLEGSVQRSPDRVRITAQLIDGRTGGHLWSERYDRQIDDIFAVQDEVTEMIVGTLASGYGGRLRKAWQRRAREAKTQNVQAFDCFMRGLDFTDHFTREDTQRGRALFEEAVELDPNYAKAYAKLAWGHIEDAYQGWSNDYEESLARGLEFANKAIECEDEESWGHWALAGYHMFTGQHDRALAEFQRAIELNPNDADVLNDFGLCLGYAGRAVEGLELVHKAMHLNPHYPEWYSLPLGQIYFDAHKYEEAVATFEGLLNLETTISCLYQAASYAALGQSIKAREAIARILELDSMATLEKWTSARFVPYSGAKDLEHFRENLRKAGLPE